MQCVLGHAFSQRGYRLTLAQLDALAASPVSLDGNDENNLADLFAGLSMLTPEQFFCQCTLFILEGIPAVLVGVYVWFGLPGKIVQASS
jgi:hypothetical protein